MKYLITSSLLDGFDFLKNCPKKWQQKAQDDFLAMLRREPRPTSEACLRGIRFERLVCDNCNKLEGGELKRFLYAHYSAKTKDKELLKQAVDSTYEVAERCRGGEQQIVVMRDMEINGQEYHLYGIADILFPDKIIDIKTTGCYKGDKVYRNRSQHLIYSLCTGINRFDYVVADYQEKSNPVKTEIVEIEQSQEESEKALAEKIDNLMTFLDLAGLKEDYVEKFTKLHKDKK